VGADATIDLAQIGVRGAALLEREERWIHRRVESMTVGPDLLVRRRLSIDFTVPADLHEIPVGAGNQTLSYLPVSVLRKWPPIWDLDIEDEYRRPLPLLTSIDNGIADAAALIELARRALGKEQDEPLSGILEDGLREIATAPPSLSRNALARVFDANTQDEDQKKLVNNRQFFDIARGLVTNSILWLPILSERGRRRIVKIAYDVSAKGQLALWRTLLTQLGWLPGVALISAPHVGEAASYHLQIYAWPDSEVIDAGLVAEAVVPVEDDVGDPNEERDSPPPAMKSEVVRKTAHVQVEGQSAHLYLTGARMGSNSIASVSIRLRRRGGLLASAATVVTITVLLLGFRLWPSAIFTKDPAGPVAVLLIVPAVLAAFLARPVPSAEGSSLFAGLRLLVALGGALAVLAAFALIAWGHDTAEKVWLVGAGVAGGLGGIFVVSLILPRRQPGNGA
jgi:hypothetical protein